MVRLPPRSPLLPCTTLFRSRPLVAALLATASLVALTLPVLGLRLGFPDAGNDREGTTTRTAYELIADGFGPGAAGPLLVVGDPDRKSTRLNSSHANISYAVF